MPHSKACVLLLVLLASPAQARERRVQGDAQLRAALQSLRPGDKVLLAPGEYRGGITLDDVHGEAERPIVIAGADPEHPPVFVGGSQALHLVQPRHVVLRDLVIREQPSNGINVDEGGPGAGEAHHVLFERLRFERIGPTGNHDALKLSGLTDFEVRDCEFVGWGGSGVDMVGCQRGLLVGCRFEGVEGCSQHSGVQAKGGTAQVTIRACRFDGAGQRSLNLGGSTGLKWFRPSDAPYEAKDLTVEGCRFRDSESFVAFVGVDGAVVRQNTFYRPRRWVLRILQESRDERFLPCRNGRFERNLIVFQTGELHRFVNVGSGTAPETFVFAENWWFAADAQGPRDHRPQLPTTERGSVLGEDPHLDTETLEARGKARGYGADSLP